MGTAGVVEIEPLGRQSSHLFQTFKDIHIEDRLPIGPVESFDESVLHRAAGADEFEFDLVPLGPIGHCDRGELRSVVEPQTLRQSSHLGDAVEHTDDTAASQVEIDLDREALPPMIVDHVERAEPASVAQRIRHEVSRPALVRILGNRERIGIPPRDPTLELAAFVELHLAIDTINALMVPPVPGLTKQIVELAEPQIRMIPCEFTQRIDDRFIASA